MLPRSIYVGVNPDQIEALGERLVPYLAKFKDCFATERGRAHFQTYVQGQLGPLERKSVEPMADAAGIPPRSLQEFLRLLRWDEDAVRDRVQSLVARRGHHGEEIFLLDRRVSPRRATPRHACSVSTAARPARSTTAS